MFHFKQSANDSLWVGVVFRAQFFSEPGKEKLFEHEIHHLP